MRGAGQSRQRPCGVTPAWPLSCGRSRARNQPLWHRPPLAAARLLKRPASRRGTGLRVARTGEEFVHCDHRGAGDDGDGRHHQNNFEHVSLPTEFNASTPEESCSGKTRELRGRAVGRFVAWATRPGSAFGDRWRARRDRRAFDHPASGSDRHFPSCSSTANQSVSGSLAEPGSNGFWRTAVCTITSFEAGSIRIIWPRMPIRRNLRCSPGRSHT